MASVETDLEAAVGAEIPDLEDWISLPAVGDMLDVARQRVFQMVKEGKFTTIRKVRGAAPEPGKRKRPAVYVVRTEEAQKYKDAQLAAIAGRDQ